MVQGSSIAGKGVSMYMVFWYITYTKGWTTPTQCNCHSSVQPFNRSRHSSALRCIYACNPVSKPQFVSRALDRYRALTYCASPTSPSSKHKIVLMYTIKMRVTYSHSTERIICIHLRFNSLLLYHLRVRVDVAVRYFGFSIFGFRTRTQWTTTTCSTNVYIF